MICQGHTWVALSGYFRSSTSFSPIHGLFQGEALLEELPVLCSGCSMLHGEDTRVAL